MLQNPGACYRAFLGHMAYDKNSDSQPFRQLHEHVGRLPDLGHAAGSGGHLFVVHGLDGVDDDQVRTAALDDAPDGVQVGLAQELQVIAERPHAVCPQLDLGQGFLPGYIQHLLLGRKPLAHLQKERGFSDSRIAPHQDQGAGHDPPAQHPVQLIQSGLKPGLVVRPDLRQGEDLYLFPGLYGSGLCRGDHFLSKCIPLLTGRALPQPLRLLMPAVLAEIYGFLSFCHSSLPRSFLFFKKFPIEQKQP